MSGEACPDTQVYYCLVCGPVLQEIYPAGLLTLHKMIPHPAYLTFDEDENPQ